LNRNKSKVEGRDAPEPALSQAVRDSPIDCDKSDTNLVGATGLEQSAIATQKPHFACRGDAKSAATSARPGQPDPDLACLADSWPHLPPSIKVGIVAMVKATSQEGSVEGRD
jgi:hypothetical protein